MEEEIDYNLQPTDNISKMLMENNTFTNALIVVINLEEQKETMILKAFHDNSAYVVQE